MKIKQGRIEDPGEGKEASGGIFARSHLVAFPPKKKKNPQSPMKERKVKYQLSDAYCLRLD